MSAWVNHRHSNTILSKLTQFVRIFPEHRLTTSARNFFSSDNAFVKAATGVLTPFVEVKTSVLRQSAVSSFTFVPLHLRSD